MNKGGGEKIIPNYQEPRFNPAIPEKQREAYNIRNNERQPQQNNPMINLQVFHPPKPRGPPIMGQQMPPYNINPATFIPQIVQTPFTPPQFMYQAMGGLMQPMPIIKNYNISTNGPSDSHIKLNIIFEDILPSAYRNGTAKTLSERNTLTNYLRGRMFSQGDGSDIDLDGSTDNSLLSRLKFMDLNPYNTNKFSQNPYKGLPADFLIYRSCYPIRHEPVGNHVSCAKDSIASNVRIYKLPNEALQLYYQSMSRSPDYLEEVPNNKLADYDMWRDISYYEYVREQIIKPLICPNFTIMYGYYISQNSKISFMDLEVIRGGVPKNVPIQKRPMVDVPDISRPIVDLIFDPFKPDNFVEEGIKDTLMRQKGITRPQVNFNPVQGTSEYNGKALIAITESPLYNIMGWASPSYQKEGVVARMVNEGYYDDNIWMSVLFQILAGLYTMQIHGFYFNDFTPEDNIYIKDLQLQGQVTQHWKYKVDGVDFYVPNFGYLVMLDSNYKDVRRSTVLGASNKECDKKLYAKWLDADITNFKEKTFEQFKRTFTPNIFNQEFVRSKGVKPPPKILQLLTEMEREISRDKNSDIGTYFVQFFSCYLHNRIGTYLKEIEIANIRSTQDNLVGQFNKGDLVVYLEGSDTYKFALYVKQNGQNSIIMCSDRRDSKIKELEVPTSLLLGYSQIEKVQQNFKQGVVNLNEDEILESYIISSK